MTWQSATIAGVSPPARKKSAPDDGEFDAAVGACIESAMEKAGLNSYKLARLAGIDRPYLSKIINGKRRANMDIIRDVAKALDVSAAALLPGGEKLQDPGSTGLSDPPATVLPDGTWRIIVRNSEADHVALIVNNLDKPERERILRYAEAVRDEGKDSAEAEPGSSRPRQSK